MSESLFLASQQGNKEEESPETKLKTGFYDLSPGLRTTRVTEFEETCEDKE